MPRDDKMRPQFILDRTMRSAPDRAPWIPTISSAHCVATRESAASVGINKIFHQSMSCAGVRECLTDHSGNGLVNFALSARQCLADGDIHYY
jgi:hypothetical protein